MNILVGDNPNSAASEELVFNEIGPRRAIRAIVAEEGGKEVRYEVTAVGEGGRFFTAHAVKVTDSGEGFAFLIYGGEWGIRLRREGSAAWDLTDRTQWGEPFKLYGSESDIEYGGDA
jgi:hypothetical protein